MVPNLSLNFLDSPDKVGEFWTWLTSHHDYIAADTETTDLNWWHSSFRVRLFQFGDTETGWAIPFQEWKGLVAGALKWLADRRVLTVWHNLAFDYQALKSEGIVLDLSCQHDTFIWANLVGFAEESRKLKNMAARYFGQWALFGAKMLDRGMHNGGWTWATVPMNFHPYTVYGAVDPILTAMYFEKIRKLMPPFMWHHSLEIASIDTTGLMMRNGLAVDTQYAHDQLQILDSREAEVLARLSEHGITSANQNAAVAKVLEDAGVVPDIAKRTSTGQLQVDKAFLETITHPVAHEVLLARRIHKTGTYFKAMLREAQGVLSPRELIHPNIRAIEAKTGRMSIADPALQQLPAPDDDDPETQIVRRAVIPRTDDEILVGADFGQIELRVFASLTNDQNLLAVLKETDAAKARGDHANADFFVAMGRDVYHDPTFKKSDHRRKMLKATTYATMYSAGEEKIASTAKVSQPEIHAVLEAMKERYVAFRTLGEELLTNEGIGPYGEPVTSVRTPTGRRFAVAHRDERRKLLNYLIQGHSAEVLKMAIQNVREAGYEDELLLPVHDELIMSVPKGTEEKATRDLVECMNAVIDPSQYGVAIQASAGTPAMNWAELSH